MPKQYAIALGTFDGLHLGHMAVLHCICKKGLSPLALTFDVPPKMNDSHDAGLLMTAADKHRSLKEMGIEPVILDFAAVRDLSPVDFLNEIVSTYHPALIATGFNFRFGRGAAGDVTLLRQFCNQHHIEYAVADPVIRQEQAISSTRIRAAIAAGDVLQAEQLLGRRFSYESPIVHGDQRGRTIGFPTINQAYPTTMIPPRFGVYSSVTEIDGKRYPSVTNIGKRPTFATDYIISETHLFDYSGDAYGKNARVYLTEFIRDEVRFSGVEELKAAITKDKAQALRFLK